MVTLRTRRRWPGGALPPLLRRLLLAMALAAWLVSTGCTTLDGPTEDVDLWKQGWKRRASAVADGAARGAEAVGESLGTAYSGVRNGFQEPDPKAYGPYPKNFAERLRRHMIHFEGTPEDASFRFDAPQRSYTNEGILAGGAIDWQGYAVDFEVETTTFAGQKRRRAYVARMNGDEVLEVLDAAYASGVQRVEDPSRPAARPPE